MLVINFTKILNQIFQRLSSVTTAHNTAQWSLLSSLPATGLHTARVVLTTLRANGQAERTVKNVKKLLKESPDPCLALLSYRATPLPWCGLSPSELSMGRRLRTDIPQVKQNLIPCWPHTKEFKEQDKEFKLKQTQNFDDRHRVKALPDIPDNTNVWVNTNNPPTKGRVVAHANAPRSYVVDTPSGAIRRNRSQLNVVPQPAPSSDSTPLRSTREPIMTRSRTGTSISPPNRL